MPAFLVASGQWIVISFQYHESSVAQALEGTKAMKLEFLSDGLLDRSLIRLYGFDQTGAMRLREAIRTLSTKLRQSIPLHEEWWIEPVDDCRLDLRIGTRNLGVVERVPSKFECIVTSRYLDAA